MRIMITDDHARFRSMLRSLLQDVADEIIECTNGAEAVLACQQRRPDWLLIDLRMPVMDGLDAIRAIRTADPTARVIVVTNYGDEALRQQASALGVAGFVLKEDLGQLRPLLVAASRPSPLVSAERMRPPNMRRR